MKKLFSVFSVLFCLLTFTTVGISTVSAISKNDNQNVEIDCKSKSAYLMDYNSNTVIYSKNELERLPIASMCKVMTLLICYENVKNGTISLDQEITVSQNASGMGGSQVFLETNGKYLVKDLLKSIAVASANDACVAMAETICGSEENFVTKMNEKANELSMENTRFSNCTGLPKAEQYSCAKDVAKMFSELLKNEEYFEISRIWMDEIVHPGGRVTGISNTNKLIRFYQGCDSGKTGYTSEAGHCLVASAKRNDMRLVAVVISSPDSKTRFSEVSSFFSYGFNNYTNKMVVDKNKPLDLTVNVEKGKCDKIEIIPEKSLYIFTKKNENISLNVEFNPKERVKAPIKKGEAVGEITVYKDNVAIETINVLSNQDVEKMTFFDVIKDVLEGWKI